MRKCFLCILSIGCLFLNGCSSHKIYSINTDKLTTGKFIENLTITNGFTISYIDAINGIYRIETDKTSFSSGIYSGIHKDLNSGFGLRLKEINPKCTVIISDSFGYGLNGHYYNKTKRYVKRLKEEGYTVVKGNNCL